MNGAKPFIKWVGGKTQLLSQIDQNLPNNFIWSTYVEPFVGGGAVLFYILGKYPDTIKRVIINDINPNLINTYKVIQSKPDNLITKLERLQSKYLPLNDVKREDFYYTIRKKFNECRLSSLDKSAYFIFLLKTCYNGLWRVNSKGEMNTPMGRYKNPNICDKETIQKDSISLQQVEIIQGDFAKTIQYASPDAFYYIDSPYKPLTASASFTSYSQGGFGDSEQLRLKKFCDTINDRGGAFLESNSDVYQMEKNTFFDDLYSDYQIVRVYAKRSINSKGQKRGCISELLIKNY